MPSLDTPTRTPGRRNAVPDDRIAELCIRHHLGHYTNRPTVQQRLDDLMSTNPPGVLDLLLRAADYLGVAGHDLTDLAGSALSRLEHE